MRIGELARQANVSTRVLRHYEAQALIESTRASSIADSARGRSKGYRISSAATVGIQNASSLALRSTRRSFAPWTH